MKSINSLIPAECSVIPHRRLKLPADARIFECSSDLSLDRAISTGEAVPLQTTVKNDSRVSNYLESSRIGLQCIFTVSGSGKGIVFATGNKTVFGSIAKMTSEPKKNLTPIQKEIFRFVAIMASIIDVLSVFVSILWAA
ncbi:hypothetical protein PMKS-002210 [Pichia membranifaciens]|uniref:P-type ATPase A domain-containing protein n=1 Tax=Pichia membranifaciens TaxID=4926 RepID=A0A1Q2YGX1_9ASCO|nr:hypothetical protein PMKS-002210 [Pichia membranifaciens]